MGPCRLCRRLPAKSSQGLPRSHARVLRTAGLVGSRREGKMVMYFLTDAGRALLEAVLPARMPA